jgi:hypothetical protein
MAALERTQRRLRRIWPWALGLPLAAAVVAVAAGQQRGLRNAEDVLAQDVALLPLIPLKDELAAAR